MSSFVMMLYSACNCKASKPYEKVGQINIFDTSANLLHIYHLQLGKIGLVLGQSLQLFLKQAKIVNQIVFQ